MTIMTPRITAIMLSLIKSNADDGEPDCSGGGDCGPVSSGGAGGPVSSDDAGGLPSPRTTTETGMSIPE